MSLPCEPVIEKIRFDGQADAQVSERLKALFDEDQKHASDPVDWTDPERVLEQLGPDVLRQADEEAHRHLIEVLHLLQQGKIVLAQDLYHAAMICQHGNCADHFKLANELAGRSVALGCRPARWLFAASRDRYLVAVGRPQQFGTQLHWDPGRKWHMPALDVSTTDEDRASYDVPSLEELWQRQKKLNGGRETLRTRFQRLSYEVRSWLRHKGAS